MLQSVVILTLLALVLPVIISAKDSSITIADKGKSRAVIVVTHGAAEPEKLAASELKYFLDKVTSGDFKITDEYSKTASCLLVGPGAAKLVDDNFSTEGLGTEGIVIRTIGKNLILAGGSPRGTLYAVYTFLEDQVGCRWWAPGESAIPSKPTLKVSLLDISYTPWMEYREPYWGNQLADGEWCARNKINGARV